MKKIISNQILIWYDKNRRHFPWRETVYTCPDVHAYHTLVCEIMSQQTLLNVLLPKYIQFLQEFPTIRDLAYCDEETLRKLWTGLGYYARARNLKKAALFLIEDLNGIFPKKQIDWLKIPGCGPYTSAIVSSICYKDPSPAVDGNVIRVFARLNAIEDEGIWKPAAHKKIFDSLSQIISVSRPGDFNQALMDIGAMVCKKQNPICSECPVQTHCLAFKENKVDKCPSVKPRKQDVSKNIFAIVFSPDVDLKHIYLVQRSSGFLKKTKGFPLFTETEKIKCTDLQKMLSRSRLTYTLSEKSFSHKITNNKISGRVLSLCGSQYSHKKVKEIYHTIFGEDEPFVPMLVKKDNLVSEISSSLDQKVLKLLS